MKVSVTRKNTTIYPDFSRVIARFFYTGEDRALFLISKILDLPEATKRELISQTFREFSRRHRDLTGVFERNCKKVSHVLKGMGINVNDLEKLDQWLIGSFFTMEYSIESAASFNPSAIIAPDQSGLDPGEKRIIVTFRATGEGHISSLVFRHAIIRTDHSIDYEPSAGWVGEAEVIKPFCYHKSKFLEKLLEMDVDKELTHKILAPLEENFFYTQLYNRINEFVRLEERVLEKTEEEMLWLADSHYEIHFSYDTDITERVIFPVSSTEQKGMEDARFVQFVGDDGEKTYYATYTAYDGHTILPKLIHTDDFYHFQIMPVHGKWTMNKNLALFPRKINGKYAMLSRIDGLNNYIMFSDSITTWRERPILLQEPRHPWEMVQIGNCGSPIETPEGWLLITHGVGAMRRYSLGASLLDLDDPTREIGRLREPMLVPTEEEREGYVPNVVYSCGSIVHDGELVVPYAVSDYSSSFASINLQELVTAIIQNGA